MLLMLSIALICVHIRTLIPLMLLPCLPKCLHYAGSQHLMLWNEVVSNGLVNYSGVLVLVVNQMVLVWRVPKCFESAEMQRGDIPLAIYIHIYIYRE